MKRVVVLLIAFVFFNCCSSKSVKSNFRFYPAMDMMRAKVPDSLRHLIPILDSVYIRDQEPRMRVTPLSKKEIKKLAITDSLNFVIVDSIVARYGFLPQKEIGLYGSLAISMVMIHAPSRKKDKIFPIMGKALLTNRIRAEEYALWIDKYAIQKGKLQVFGTQVYTLPDGVSLLVPVIDIDSMMYRRRSIGFDASFELYMKFFKITWDIEKYKKEMPDIIKRSRLVEDSTVIPREVISEMARRKTVKK